MTNISLQPYRIHAGKVSFWGGCMEMPDVSAGVYHSLTGGPVANGPVPPSRSGYPQIRSGGIRRHKFAASKLPIIVQPPVLSFLMMASGARSCNSEACVTSCLLCLHAFPIGWRLLRTFSNYQAVSLSCCTSPRGTSASFCCGS